MAATNADLREISKNAPREIHKELVAGFLICVGIAVFIAIYFTVATVQPLAWAGVAVAGVAAVIFAIGMAPRSEAGVMQAIKEGIVKVLEENGTLTPEQVAKKLDWNDALTIDMIRFMVEEGELEKDPHTGRVKLHESLTNE
jgi:hypothetical protein